MWNAAKDKVEGASTESLLCSWNLTLPTLSGSNLSRLDMIVFKLKKRRKKRLDISAWKMVKMKLKRLL